MKVIILTATVALCAAWATPAAAGLLDILPLPSPTPAPEIDSGAARTMFALLVGSAFVLRDRLRRP